MHNDAPVLAAFKTMAAVISAGVTGVIDSAFSSIPA
jgi:hypothetical protein